MSQHRIEVILVRQLASHLATPIFVVGPQGDLLYFNEPAELILGVRFDETGSMSRDELWEVFRPTRVDGTPLPRSEQPLVLAHTQRRPAHGRMRIRRADGQESVLEGTAFPLVGVDGEVLAAVGIFAEAAE